MMSKSKIKTLIRLLSLVSRSGRQGIIFERADGKITLKLKQGSQNVPAPTFDFALADGLVSLNENTVLITSSGKSSLKRHLCDHDPYAGQHRILESSTVKIHEQVQQVTCNLAESPLARLYARKQKDGSSYISPVQYEAGNRLRRDFEKAQMQPSITAHWSERASTGNTARTSAGSGEISDFAMDARTRLDKAIRAVGPELSGVTLDICCYLKGFELVERERNWPGRSAKLMLKTALATLSRHYGYDATTDRRANTSTIKQWGSRDYRPNITCAAQQFP